MSSQITASNFILKQPTEFETPLNLEQENIESNRSNLTNPSNNLPAYNDASIDASNTTGNVKTKSVFQVNEDLNENNETVNKAMEVVVGFMQLSTQNVNFEKDDTSDKTIIKVFDGQSKDLIKQFPSEEIIDIANKILDLRQDIGMKTGILLDEQV
jgi:flagellar protein FlaG